MDETLLEYGVFITPDFKVLKPYTEEHRFEPGKMESGNASETAPAKRGLLALAIARNKDIK
ncbi:MAG: hypothetical protein II054_10135 [Treponema sp.]|nr:hypothetical protein [Treponema sp.]MBQ1662851.1 hypothetical protein [Treponema sp.]MBQ2080533.1 hypothetical protein [Treponema sp.]MBR6296235.1 hypothetical protein [Treponema sp.]MEE3313513.1 hypothetical protein [Treponema sp.]